jgi:hypothetical protein
MRNARWFPAASSPPLGRAISRVRGARSSPRTLRTTTRCLTVSGVLHSQARSLHPSLSGPDLPIVFQQHWLHWLGICYLRLAWQLELRAFICFLRGVRAEPGVFSHHPDRPRDLFRHARVSVHQDDLLLQRLLHVVHRRAVCYGVLRAGSGIGLICLLRPTNVLPGPDGCRGNAVRYYHHVSHPCRHDRQHGLRANDLVQRSSVHRCQRQQRQPPPSLQTRRVRSAGDNSLGDVCCKKLSCLNP